jgi:hypothetical protein
MDKRQKIIADHPLLFSQVKYFECGDGWLDLIERLADELEPLIQKFFTENPEAEYAPACAQVKEKYGTLHFYMYTETDEMNEIIDRYEKESAIRCEICGEPGMTIGKRWYTTRCTKHLET